MFQNDHMHIPSLYMLLWFSLVLNFLLICLHQFYLTQFCTIFVEIHQIMLMGQFKLYFDPIHFRGQNFKEKK
jgi:hypothetical protein